MAAKIKKGDRVVVLTGKDKGRRARSPRCCRRKAACWSSGPEHGPAPHPPEQADPQGGIKHKEASLHVSNVALVDSKRQADPRRLPHRRRQEGPRVAKKPAR